MLLLQESQKTLKQRGPHLGASGHTKLHRHQLAPAEELRGDLQSGDILKSNPKNRGIQTKEIEDDSHGTPVGTDQVPFGTGRL